MTTILSLCAFAFLVGFVDALVGAGRLLRVPALFIVLPDTAAATLLGTNKLASTAGTAAAAHLYGRRVAMDRQVLLSAVLPAFAFAALGARSVSLIETDIVSPLILALLIGVALYTFATKDFGGLRVVYPRTFYTDLNSLICKPFKAAHANGPRK